MKKYSLLLMLLPALFFLGCAGGQDKKEKTDKSTEISQADKDLLVKAQAFFKVMPPEAPNPENVITDAKVKLGKILYYDNRLSMNNTQSCNTCHNIATYGVDNLPTSPGDNGIPGTRNSPTVFNAAFKGAQFWDGRNKDVEEQAGGPILNPAEMAIPSEHFLIERLKGVEMYQQLFADAFPEEEDNLTYKNVQNAIGAFERTLLTPSAFDDYLANDHTALNAQEKRGLSTFIDQGCIVCHTGSMLGGTMLQKFALFGNYWDLTGSEAIDYGKFTETKVEADKFMFYVPLLRNVEKTAPYFHDGSVADLGETVKIMAKTELNRDLNEEQIADIVAFLNTLTGEISAEAATVPVELEQ